MYTFLFDTKNAAKLYATAEQYASDPELSFDKNDARELRAFAEQLISKQQACSRFRAMEVLGIRLIERFKDLRIKRPPNHRF